MDAKDIMRIVGVLQDLGPAIKNMPTEATLKELIVIAPAIKSMPTDATLRELLPLLREAMPSLKQLGGFLSQVSTEDLRMLTGCIKSLPPEGLSMLGSALRSFTAEDIAKLPETLKGLLDLVSMLKADVPV